jgi:hypothetical protein
MKREGCRAGYFRVGNDCVKVGYNSHGRWSTLGEIRELEVGDRGNQFPQNVQFPDDTPAIWITVNPRKAARYVLTADKWDSIDAGAHIDPEVIRDLYQIEIQSNDRIINEDGDGGFLLVRPKAVSLHDHMKTKSPEQYKDYMNARKRLLTWPEYRKKWRNK